MKFAEGSLETRGKQDFPAATVPGGPQRSGGALSSVDHCFLVCGFFFPRLFFVNWGLSGRCDFPSVSPLRRHETCSPVELLGCSSRRKINCFIRTAMLSAEGMGRG